MFAKALRYALWISENFWLLLRNGNMTGALLYGFRSIMRSKRPLQVTIQSRDLWIRPVTHDLDVAISCFSGEFSEAIRVTKTAHHSFIIDAGGYIGTAAIVFAEAFPSAKVLTLEPSDDNFAILIKNVRPYANIIPIKKALGPAIGSAQLRDVGMREWGFSLVECASENSRASFLQLVDVTTIDELMAEHGASGIDLLKLDIEGAELALLKDCPPWLASTRTIIAELHDRVVLGCSEAFERATCGRTKIECGEKVLSVPPS